MLLNNRQKQVLCSLIEDHILNASPVGSKTLVEDYKLPYSSATIRNDLAALEKMGFVVQPHTSAGRIPTEKAYLFYLENVVSPLKDLKTTRKIENTLDACSSTEEALKSLAKKLVELTNEMVILAFDKNWSYYTGVSNLFSKPEFNDFMSISALVDKFDEVIGGIFTDVTEEPLILIGSDNPFGEAMSTIVVRYTLQNNNSGLLGVVGPLRMNYSKNLGAVSAATELLKESAYE